MYFYTSCTLTTLKYIQVSFVQYCPLRNYTKMFAEMWGVYSLLWDNVCAEACLLGQGPRLFYIQGKLNLSFNYPLIIQCWTKTWERNQDPWKQEQCALFSVSDTDAG